jgi:hypothetical protein
LFPLHDWFRPALSAHTSSGTRKYFMVLPLM